jgi:hypothetical protein
MRNLGIACLFLFAPGANAQGVDYTGFWKRNCEDDQGVQIRRLREGQYSISFCKIGGCTAPGGYRPNSRIDGDPAYEVLGPTRIRLKHAEGGYTAYVKCSSDLNPAPQRR